MNEVLKARDLLESRYGVPDGCLEHYQLQGTLSRHVRGAETKSA